MSVFACLFVILDSLYMSAFCVCVYVCVLVCISVSGLPQRHQPLLIAINAVSTAFQPV